MSQLHSVLKIAFQENYIDIYWKKFQFQKFLKKIS